MSKEDQKSKIRSKLFPVETINVNGVVIEIRPLRHGLVCEATDFLWEVVTRVTTKTLTREALTEAVAQLNRYLDECVSMPVCPDWKIEDYPESCIPEILEIFIEHTLKPGNWETLARNLKDKFGMLVSQGQNL